MKQEKYGLICGHERAWGSGHDRIQLKQSVKALNCELSSSVLLLKKQDSKKK